MAKMDHYENGEWVGSTETQGHSNTTGWVNTYSADGKVRSTWVENTDNFDYKAEQHLPRSIEEIQNERAGKEALNKLFDKLYKPIMFLGLLGVIAMIIGVIIYYVLQALPNDIVENLKSIGTIILIIITALIYVAGFLLVVSMFLIPFKSKKKSKKKKK